MFTGIVATIGHLRSAEPLGGDFRLLFDGGGLDLVDVAIGDSIAVAGTCLTVVALEATGFAADVSRETLRLTTLGALQSGNRVNLEKALRYADRLGGHLVSGHVDGVGAVVEIRPDARSTRWTFEAPAALARYIAPKGSICIDGTSLTVNEVDCNRFCVNLIPHTLANTTFGERAVGDAVNLEVDMIARYVERLLDKTSD